MWTDIINSVSVSFTQNIQHKISDQAYEKASDCDSCPREEIINRNRHKCGPILKLSGKIFNDAAKYIQGSAGKKMGSMQEQMLNFRRDMGTYF